ncbi:MAG: hypothetical protein COC09_03290 [Gammaproteobacteria bacterium]|nr:DUF2007 domain-containing protein [Gammaproteobacteria bacterium]PCH63088.1 MAG: hypothetical protein COC09_06655 [Gammaproteobacteria bacterium]PCH64274.1 MAG: hypothetical protein COC09_03290 [Gammaproteobacteria bacterium]
MKKLQTSIDCIELGFLQGVLESEGVHCVIKNEFLSGASGELPINETWPEIWVADDEWGRGKEILAGMLLDAGTESWRCDQCGELMEPQFSVCWRCVEDVKSD